MQQQCKHFIHAPRVIISSKFLKGHHPVATFQVLLLFQEKRAKKEISLFLDLSFFLLSNTQSLVPSGDARFRHALPRNCSGVTQRGDSATKNTKLLHAARTVRSAHCACIKNKQTKPEEIFLLNFILKDIQRAIS